MWFALYVVMWFHLSSGTPYQDIHYIESYRTKSSCEEARMNFADQVSKCIPLGQDPYK